MYFIMKNRNVTIFHFLKGPPSSGNSNHFPSTIYTREAHVHIWWRQSVAFLRPPRQPTLHVLLTYTTRWLHVQWKWRIKFSTVERCTGGNAECADSNLRVPIGRWIRDPGDNGGDGMVVYTFFFFNFNLPRLRERNTQQPAYNRSRGA